MSPDHRPDFTAEELDTLRAYLDRHGNGAGPEEAHLSSHRSLMSQWPAPLAEEAFHGLAGRTVRAIEPYSEADRAALLTSYLVAVGSAAGRAIHALAEADRHTGALYVLIVGETAKGRKGTSWGRVRVVLSRADDSWTRRCITSGAVSGEGLVWEVRDPITRLVAIKEGKPARPTGEYVEEIVDPGIEDKRRLWIAAEFSSVLKAGNRDSNTLSSTLREAWDGHDLKTSAKNNPAMATGQHTSMLAHITQDELRRLLTETDTANGYANRYLFVCSKRSKVIPRGQPVPEAVVHDLAAELREALRLAQAAGRLDFDHEAGELWDRVYEPLSDGRRGMLGAVTSRGEAQVLRLALVYALLDLSTEIRVEHLRAALAIWDYCYRSAAYLFTRQLGDPVADTIFQAAQRAGASGLTRTEIRDLFGRHQRADKIEAALETLARMGLMRCEKETSGGRPAERWLNCDISDISDQSPVPHPLWSLSSLSSQPEEGAK